MWKHRDSEPRHARICASDLRPSEIFFKVQSTIVRQTHSMEYYAPPQDCPTLGAVQPHPYLCIHSQRKSSSRKFLPVQDLFFSSFLVCDYDIAISVNCLPCSLLVRSFSPKSYATRRGCRQSDRRQLPSSCIPRM
jgi:hypothetical protein